MLSVVTIIKMSLLPKTYMILSLLSFLDFLVIFRFPSACLHSTRTLYWGSICIVKWVFSHVSDTRIYFPSHHGPFESGYRILRGIYYIMGVRQRFILIRQTPKDIFTRIIYIPILRKSFFGSSSMLILPSAGNTPKNFKRWPWSHLDQSPIPFHALQWTLPPNSFEQNSRYPT